MTVLLESDLSSVSQAKIKSSYQVPTALSEVLPGQLQKAKRHCAPQAKSEAAFSFKKSFLSLLLFVGLF